MRKIEIGQRYKKVRPPGTVWEVLELVLDKSQVRHFRLQNLDDPTTISLLSEHALANQRLYRLVPQQ